MSEIENIQQRYARRETGKQSSLEMLFVEFMTAEREEKYKNILSDHFKDLSLVKLLEIGAGGGGNIPFFLKMKLRAENIYANELLPDRVQSLENNFPDIHVMAGDALEIDETKKYDVVFQSTVFTSILDWEFRKRLAGKMTKLLREGGMILWYDFAFDNPNNSDVKRVTRKEIKELFPEAKRLNFYKVTLAPPIGRKVGYFYPLLNSLSFLRTHIIAKITF